MNEMDEIEDGYYWYNNNGELVIAEVYSTKRESRYVFFSGWEVPEKLHNCKANLISKIEPPKWPK